MVDTIPTVLVCHTIGNGAANVLKAFNGMSDGLLGNAQRIGVGRRRRPVCGVLHGVSEHVRRVMCVSRLVRRL